MPLAFCLISHSYALAQALSQLAAQMAPDVHCVSVGGKEEFGLDMPTLQAEVRKLEDTGYTIILMADLGSSRLGADMLADNETIFVGRGPFVEGTIAGMARAQKEADVREVLAAIAQARNLWPESPEIEPAPSQPRGSYSVKVRVGEAQGIHARPAALLAALAAQQQAPVLINGVEADSMMNILLLNLRYGDVVEISTPGPEGQEGVDLLAQAIRVGSGQG